jgi:hypothetical protein
MKRVCPEFTVPDADHELGVRVKALGVVFGLRNYVGHSERPSSRADWSRQMKTQQR